MAKNQLSEMQRKVLFLMAKGHFLNQVGAFGMSSPKYAIGKGVDSLDVPRATFNILKKGGYIKRISTDSYGPTDLGTQAAREKPEPETKLPLSEAGNPKAEIDQPSFSVAYVSISPERLAELEEKAAKWDQLCGRMGEFQAFWGAIGFSICELNKDSGVNYG